VNHFRIAWLMMALIRIVSALTAFVPLVLNRREAGDDADCVSSKILLLDAGTM
jgi:hypothetical protein